ncbi:Ni/Co efflux regulator RcnB [Variovorax soli]|uniref:Ni/Co efflux regulator RcnB n=2 Tax=Variovorax soli TaxID=376815 RepID=A0ABU1ND85_9BURK|nr:Ni/Co efflux regulator RcnB [Variovorax soli]
MRKLVLTIGMALASMMATTAFGQGGEADPAQAKARPAPKTSATQRAAARNERKAEGAEAARGPQIGEGVSKPEPEVKVSSEERRAATAKRRATNRAANKAGAFSRGGNVDAPERQKPPVSPRSP